MAGTKVGPAPYGYNREGGRLVMDRVEAPVRLRMFELFAEHERRKTVCEILNAEGHRTRAGALFTSQTITRLLEDKNAIGIDGEVDALVSEDLWQRCNAILQSQKGKGGAPRKVTNLFSGFVHCGCGQKMYVPTNTSKYVCSDCRTKIAGDDLEDIFHAQLQKYPLPEELKSGDQSLSDKWASFTFDKKRKLVEAMTKRIEVADKKVTCFLFFV